MSFTTPTHGPSIWAVFRLSDDLSLAGETQFVVRPLTFIGPRGWTVWIADGATNKGPDHLSFNLDSLGETLRIYSSTGAVIDSVDYPAQAPEVSEGAFPTALPTLSAFPAPDRAAPPISCPCRTS